MKTKITNISPDQNIIEHESGLKTVFVPIENLKHNCNLCVYKGSGNCLSTFKPCDPSSRKDRALGYFKQLLP